MRYKIVRAPLVHRHMVAAVWDEIDAVKPWRSPFAHVNHALDSDQGLHQEA